MRSRATVQSPAGYSAQNLRGDQLATRLRDSEASTPGSVDEPLVEALARRLPAQRRRGAFTLPATIYTYGDSFQEQPNAHTAGDSMAKKACDLLGVIADIDATSGETSADKQDGIFSREPAATDISFIALGQNDVQFVGNGADVEGRLNDVGALHLANHFQLGVPTGARRYLASAMTPSGGHAWVADGDIAEGGALKSSQQNDVLQALVADSRFVVVIYKVKNGNAGKFRVYTDETSYVSPADSVGFSAAPYGTAVLSNTGQTYARYALVFDLGRRKPLTKVQMQVTSATGAGNVVSICAVYGLSGEPLDGPMVAVADLSDRGDAGYLTAAASVQNLPTVSRLINQSAAIAAACGLRMVPVALSTALTVATDLAVDEFHPSEVGATVGAAAIVEAIENAATDLSVTRPDLETLAMMQNAAGHPLMLQLPVVVGADGLQRRQKLRTASIDWQGTDGVALINVTASFRIVYDLTQDPANCLIFAREAGAGGIAYVGNLGATGQLNLLAAGTTQLVLDADELYPGANLVHTLGRLDRQFLNLYAGYVTPAVRTVATLGAPSAALTGARSQVTDATTTNFGAVVVGGGGNNVPVYCDGVAWRIG
jgi:hypothetical protein